MPAEFGAAAAERALLASGGRRPGVRETPPGPRKEGPSHGRRSCRGQGTRGQGAGRRGWTRRSACPQGPRGMPRRGRTPAAASGRGSTEQQDVAGQGGRSGAERDSKQVAREGQQVVWSSSQDKPQTDA